MIASVFFLDSILKFHHDAKHSSCNYLCHHFDILVFLQRFSLHLIITKFLKIRNIVYIIHVCTAVDSLIVCFHSVDEFCILRMFLCVLLKKSFSFLIYFQCSGFCKEALLQTSLFILIRKGKSFIARTCSKIQHCIFRDNKFQWFNHMFFRRF